MDEKGKVENRERSVKDILLVFDDDRLNLRSLGRVIRGIFDEMLMAQTASQAEEHLRSKEVTHLLCDRNLAEQLKGEQFIEMWRERWPPIRYAALMSGDDVAHLREHPEIDVVHSKPIDPEALREALKRARA